MFIKEVCWSAGRIYVGSFLQASFCNKISEAKLYF